jgi:hypothetical protein
MWLKVINCYTKGYRPKAQEPLYGPNINKMGHQDQVEDPKFIYLGHGRGTQREDFNTCDLTKEVCRIANCKFYTLQYLGIPLGIQI